MPIVRLALLPLAAVLVWSGWSWLAGERQAPHAATPVFTGWAFNPFADGKPLDAQQHNADAARDADAAHARVTRLWQGGSLRGSELDGDWGSWVDDRLQPGFSLRQRFDYLLTALGEVALADLRLWIEQEVTADRGAGAARQVLSVWDRYLLLQQKVFTVQANPTDATSWQPALAERVSARRQVLGNDWAQAFYADEERAFAAFTQQQRPAEAELPLAQQALSADAAERLRAEELAWAGWERRLQSARERVQAIAAAPELSAPQRRQAQDAFLAEAFSGAELLRARALLTHEP